MRVEKPGALKHARTVAVSVERERDNFNAEAQRTQRGKRKKNSD